MSWDRRTPKQLAATQEGALKAQLVDAIGPFSPYWRARFKELGKTASQLTTAQSLATVPAVGERDVCVDGDPAAAAALVLQAGESGWALHAEGPKLRRALASRLVRSGSYRAVVEADTRPTSFVFAGLGLRFPVASTRSDLDVVARAGARLWQVLGLSRDDVLVAALELRPSASLQALQLAALGAGSPALFPGDHADEVAAALRLVPATVLAVETSGAVRVLEDLDEAGAELGSLRTVLLVGAPTDAERSAVEAAVGPGVTVLAVHVPDGHRLMWGECPGGPYGLHTYPDLELVQLVDPETGEAGTSGGPSEVVLTQLGLRGTALLRWRTADLAMDLETEACPGCGRTVPRLLGVRRRALVPEVTLKGGTTGLDLRGVAGALVGRSDLADWRIVIGKSRRREEHELVVHVVPKGDVDEAEVAVAVARDVRAASGMLPTQVVVEDPGGLPDGEPLSRRVLLRA
jgi:phenylacetate-coenzyme A ligase PaaK-like adenylate-forming protein